MVKVWGGQTLVLDHDRWRDLFKCLALFKTMLYEVEVVICSVMLQLTLRAATSCPLQGGVFVRPSPTLLMIPHTILMWPGLNFYRALSLYDWSPLGWEGIISNAGDGLRDHLWLPRKIWRVTCSMTAHLAAHITDFNLTQHSFKPLNRSRQRSQSSTTVWTHQTFTFSPYETTGKHITKILPRYSLSSSLIIYPWLHPCKLIHFHVAKH